MLAVWIRHASRTTSLLGVANEVVTRRTTYPKVKDNLSKGRIILDISSEESFSLWEWPAEYQLVGSVMDYQGYDA